MNNCLIFNASFKRSGSICPIDAAKFPLCLVSTNNIIFAFCAMQKASVRMVFPSKQRLFAESSLNPASYANIFF